MSTTSSTSGHSERDYSSTSSSRVFPALRKTDLLDILGSGRDMDSDRWSVAATLDDHESEYSFGKGTTKSVTSSVVGDKDTREEEMSTDPGDERGEVEMMDEEDRSSRFEEEEEEGGERTHYEHNGDITAPGQPQPSLVISKTYQELVEENQLLHSRLLNLQMSQQKQLAGGLPGNFNDMNLDGNGSNELPVVNITTLTISKKLGNFTAALHALIASTISNQSIAYDTATTYVAAVLPNNPPTNPAIVGQLAPYLLEKQVFQYILQHYFSALPFGGPTHDLLRTAHNDQLDRFKRTLGDEASRWHRRSTVQSLFVDPASRAYLVEKNAQFVNSLKDFIHALYPSAQIDQAQAENCAAMIAELSIEIHAGDMDINPALGGEKVTEEFVVLKEFGGGKNRVDVSPSFVDDSGIVVLAARIIMY